MVFVNPVTVTNGRKQGIRQSHPSPPINITPHGYQTTNQLAGLGAGWETYAKQGIELQGTVKPMNCGYVQRLGLSLVIGFSLGCILYAARV